MRISTSQIHQQGIDAISRLSAQSADTQQKVATGRRVRTPADDPAAAAKIVRLNQDIAARERYVRNADNAETHLQQEESVLTRVTEALQRVRELTLQAGDPVYTAADRAALGAELTVRFEELLALANGRDTQGSYLFGGFQGDVEPFSFTNGTVHYNGDSGVREIAIDSGRTIAISDSGEQLFAQASVDFAAVTVRAASDGVADARSLSVSVNDTQALQSSGARRLLVEARSVAGQTVLDIRDANDGTIVAGLEGVVAGSLVGLDDIGLDLAFAQPVAAGDRFVLEVAAQQGLLTTVQHIAEQLRGEESAGTLSDAALQDITAQTLAGIDGALDNVVRTQAKIGARLNAIDSSRVLHEDVVLKTTEVLSSLRDIDFAEAVSELNYQSFLLEAAQQSFVRVNRLSLFNNL